MKMMKLGLLSLCLCFASLAAPCFAVANSGYGVVLMEQSTGTVLFEQNADARAFVASTTKIMTALVVLEREDPATVVAVDARAVGTEGSSMYLRAGQEMTVHELLIGLMLKSGNDAAAALAYHCAGSVESFAEMMNEKAESLGMSGSHFANPHGLHDEAHYSTAKDMARLSCAAMEHPLFCELVASKFARAGEVLHKNHNKMLWMYEGADGVKTGFTKSAGRCLVSSATRDGMQLIAVTLRDPNDWADHKALLDYGFANYTMKTFCQKGELLCQRPVLGGTEPMANLLAAADVRALLPKDHEPSLVTSILVPQYFFAPLSGGSSVGEYHIYAGGELLGKTDLVSEKHIGSPLS